MAWSVKERKGEMKRTASGKFVELHPSANDFSSETAGQGKANSGLAGEKDLAGGMEMLELDFLLGVIEDTKSNDKNDVMMRKLSFGEMLRREQQRQIDSKSLMVYAVNDGNLYGKDIQCEAMKELAKRTTHKG